MRQRGDSYCIHPECCSSRCRQERSRPALFPVEPERGGNRRHCAAPSAQTDRISFSLRPTLPRSVLEFLSPSRSTTCHFLRTPNGSVLASDGDAAFLPTRWP